MLSPRDNTRRQRLNPLWFIWQRAHNAIHSLEHGAIDKDVEFQSLADHRQSGRRHHKGWHDDRREFRQLMNASACEIEST
jgi:hypothetical protein